MSFVDKNVLFIQIYLNARNLPSTIVHEILEQFINIEMEKDQDLKEIKIE